MGGLPSLDIRLKVYQLNRQVLCSRIAPMQNSSLGLQNSSPEIQNNTLDIETKGTFLEFRGAIMPGGYFAAQILTVQTVLTYFLNKFL